MCNLTIKEGLMCHSFRMKMHGKGSQQGRLRTYEMRKVPLCSRMREKCPDEDGIGARFVIV